MSCGSQQQAYDEASSGLPALLDELDLPERLDPAQWHQLDQDMLDMAAAAHLTLEDDRRPQGQQRGVGSDMSLGRGCVGSLVGRGERRNLRVTGGKLISRLFRQAYFRWWRSSP